MRFPRFIAVVFVSLVLPLLQAAPAQTFTTLFSFKDVYKRQGQKRG